VPTTTWQSAIRDISRELGHVDDFDTTTNITTDTSVISTELSALYDQDDFFIGWFILIRGTNNDEVIRRVTDYAASTGTITVAGANLQAESGSMTCELHRFEPRRIREMFNRARQDLFPHVSMVRRYDALVTAEWQNLFTLPNILRGKPLQVYLGSRPTADDVVDNLFTDGGFENWSSATALSSWTLAGTNASVNREQETTSPRNYMVLQDSYSARVVSADSGVTTVRQQVTPDVAAESTHVHVTVWVYCDTASRVSADLVGSQGGLHTGNGWERLTATTTTAQGATTITGGVHCTAGAQIDFYVDEAIMISGPTEPYGDDFVPLRNWKWTPPVEGAGNGGILEFAHPLPEKQRILIFGRDLLSAVTADSDTFEVDADLLMPLYDRTRQLLSEDAANSSFSGGREFWRERAAEYRGKWETALTYAGLRQVVQLNVPNG